MNAHAPGPTTSVCPWGAMAWLLMALRCALAADATADRLRDLTAAWEAPRRAILGPFHNLYNARVVEEPGQEYPLRMWLFGWAAADSNPVGNGKHMGDAIYHARAKDLQHWEVFSGQPDGPLAWDSTGNPRLWTPVVSVGDRLFDNAANGDPAVVKRDGVYHMVFSSVGFEPHAEMDPQRLYIHNCIMGATSRDGIRWEKTRAPILAWDGEATNRWDIAGGKETRPPDNYYGSYHRPSLLFDQGRWRLWFDYYHPGTFVCLGYAENTGNFADPAAWKVVRAGRSPLLRDWPNASVVKAGGTYCAFADAPYYPAELGGDGRQITMAESDDGLVWRVLGHIRPEGRESSHVPEALIRADADGTWLWVFYAWKPETERDREWDFRYKEVRWMRRRIP